jgi:calcineurin-like phosphoesterase
MRILFIGDIVGEPGRQAIKELVPKIVKREKIDFVIANGENTAGGSGITPMIVDELLGYGVISGNEKRSSTGSPRMPEYCGRQTIRTKRRVSGLP